MSEVIEQESTELITLPPKETALAVFTDTAKIDAILNQVREKLDGIVYDMSTTRGRDQCRSDAFRVARSKAALEKIGAAVSAEQKEIPKQIDAGRRYAKEELEKIQEQVRQPLTEWENAEEDRIASHKRGIQHIKDCGNGLIGGQPQPFGMLFHELEEKVVIDSTWEEFEAEAHRVKADALAKLKAEFEEHQKREAEQAELAKLRADAEDRRIQDERERIAKGAAERATREADAGAKAEQDAAAKREADAKAAQAKAEQDTKDAVEREKQAEARAEAEKLAAEQRAKNAAEAARQAEIKRQADETARIAAEAKAREADKQHKAAINNAALSALIENGLPEDCAKQAVILIAKGVIPAIKIHY